MKNIHLLPTEKPSRLTKPGGSSSIKLYTNGLTNTPKGHCKNYHLYITSDSETKEGDWCLNTLKNIIYKKDNLPMDIVWKKIILTTDQELIEEGIQAIDDEFLEWFVKNPSCEFVEVKHFGTCCGNQSITQCINCEKYNPIYKITIPQEEPKQETLEEYSNGLYKQSLKDDVDLTFSDGVKLGAKWQSERMYSEVFEWLSSKDYLSDKMEFIQKEFKQFKKK
jgi:hypothetical protein